eukprot:NODE_9246_length_230_cov_78.464088_g8631_i0.p1 GENE.NODE_9246_length_230_cov_78.464088_g8631_i0~~NODE_9246_length_230_cov_78.464088_g8631_i0.p1  ORF type:complete len:64 (-),score=13.99 NODE_9246_length_230_cov_78.464088_g8631_i0:39-206(-)
MGVATCPRGSSGMDGWRTESAKKSHSEQVWDLVNRRLEALRQPSQSAQNVSISEY